MLTHTPLMPEVGDIRTDVYHDWLAQSFRRAAKRATQMRCGITGHNVLLRYQPTRLSLQCTSCGYESPGWEVGPARTRRFRIHALASRPDTT
jgi:hypothetical protein